MSAVFHVPGSRRAHAASITSHELTMKTNNEAEITAPSVYPRLFETQRRRCCTNGLYCCRAGVNTMAFRDFINLTALLPKISRMRIIRNISSPEAYCILPAKPPQASYACREKAKFAPLASNGNPAWLEPAAVAIRLIITRA